MIFYYFFSITLLLFYLMILILIINVLFILFDNSSFWWCKGHVFRCRWIAGFSRWRSKEVATAATIGSQFTTASRSMAIDCWVASAATFPTDCRASRREDRTHSSTSRRTSPSVTADSAPPFVSRQVVSQSVQFNLFKWTRLNRFTSVDWKTPDFLIITAFK